MSHSSNVSVSCVRQLGHKSLWLTLHPAVNCRGSTCRALRWRLRTYKRCVADTSIFKYRTIYRDLPPCSGSGIAIQLRNSQHAAFSFWWYVNDKCSKDKKSKNSTPALLNSVSIQRTQVTTRIINQIRDMNGSKVVIDITNWVKKKFNNTSRSRWSGTLESWDGILVFMWFLKSTGRLSSSNYDDRYRWGGLCRRTIKMYQ